MTAHGPTPAEREIVRRIRERVAAEDDTRLELGKLDPCRLRRDRDSLLALLEAAWKREAEGT